MFVAVVTSGSLAFLPAGLSAQKGEKQTSGITVGPNVAISAAAATKPHYEVFGCADPKRSSDLIVGSMMYPDDSPRPQAVAFASYDGGATWALTLPSPEGAVLSGDPACTFDSRGRAYFLRIENLGSGTVSVLYRSSDGGRTWSTPTRIDMIDRNYIVAGPARSAGEVSLYLSGQASVRSIEPDEFPRISAMQAIDTYMSTFQLRLSSDAGLTFPRVFQRAAFGRQYLSIVGNPVVLSDGAVVSTFLVYKDRLQPVGVRTDALLKSVALKPGATQLEPAITVADWSFDYFAAAVPVLAVDASGGPFHDRLYSVRVDTSSGRGRVMLARSLDGGRSWLRSRAVDDEPRPDSANQRPTAANAAVGVNAAGIVMVAWGDRRDSADNMGWTQRFAVSRDGGETFSASQPVASAATTFGGHEHWLLLSTARKPSDRAASNVRVGVTTFQFTQGHTTSVITDANGVFHPIWIDNRTGTPQVWTAAIQVDGKAAEGGEEEPLLQDVTNDVELEIVGQRLQFDKRTVTITVRLRNTSKAALRVPIKLRVTQLGSDFGQIASTNADAGQPTLAALWDLSSAVGSGGLPPGGLSKERNLEFRFSNLDLPPNNAPPKSVVTFEARVLASIREPSR